MEKKPASNSSGKGTQWILIVLLALSLILNFYQWQNTTDVVQSMTETNDSLSEAKIDVDRELAETLDELNQYKGINSRLDSLLSEANGNIEKQRERIEQLVRIEKNTGSLNKKLKAELEELRKLRDEYLEKIDFLLVENSQLKQEKESLTSKVGDLTANLEKTISTASVIKSEYVKTKSFKKRSKDKYSETALAKRTNKLEVCFSVMDNKIAKPGERMVYVRMLEPGGRVLGDRSSGSSTFTLAENGEQVQYTSMEKINYNNERQDLCVNWEESERVFTSGTYIIEVYVDGMLSGSSSYLLK